jgi:phosphate transport system permease protein
MTDTCHHPTHFSARAIKKVRDGIAHYLLFLCAIAAVVVIFFILVFLLYNAYPAFATIGLSALLTGMVWNPTASEPLYGMVPLIVGTVLVTLGAMVVAVPLGIGSAIFIAEIAPYRVKRVVKPAIELLAGIPSVVYGFFGLIILTNWIRVTFQTPSGETWLAGSILLGIMALPTIVSVSEDAISSVPREYRDGSLALGATSWQTIYRVIVPSALSGITAAIILGTGRAIGETMAVLMVTGNAAVIPTPIWNVLSPVRTLTGTLGIEMGEVATGSDHYFALFAVAVVLLMITFLVNIIATYILARIRAKNMPDQESCATRTRSPRGWKVPNWAGSVAWGAACAITLILAAIIWGLTPAIALAVLGTALWYILPRVSPRYTQRAAYTLVSGAALAVLIILGIILFDIIANGAPFLTWEFLTTPPKDLGRSGGIYPAIIGTLYLVGGAIAIALPLGIGAAVYLTEYTREGVVTRVIRNAADLLNGTPSIVFGLFGFAFLVLYLGFGVCLLAGQIALACMILPTMIRTTEEALKAVPSALREGSLALGATKWQTIRSVVLPPAVPGIITGAILSIGRAAGETAPIMFTAVVFSQRFLPTTVLDPVMALPYHLFILSTNVPGADGNKYATALVLLILVVGLYLVAILVRNHYYSKVRW